MKELENLSNIAVFTVRTLILVLGMCISFIIGVTMAYYLDQAESRLPDVWSGERAELEVKPNYGYQTPHQYIEQPAYNVYGLEAEL